MDKIEKFQKIENNLTITYQGSQINMFSDERSDYVNLTDLAKAWKSRKSISAWLKNKQTLDFLLVWERKHNLNFNDTQMGVIYDLAKNPNQTLSIKAYIEKTNAVGIFTVKGAYGGTYAHKDIAIRFAGWLSPEFELYLVEEIQRLKEIERKQNSYELLTPEQVLKLVTLKEVFKYVSNQETVENAHKDVYAAHSSAKNPFADFQAMRNKILDISTEVIDERIKQYCKDHNIALTTKIQNKSKREKILFYDSYTSVKNAVWDFLRITGEINALNLSNLVEDIIRIEKGEVLRKNEDNLFHQKQDLGQFNDFDSKINSLPEVTTAREYLEYVEKRKKELKQLAVFTKKIKQTVDYNHEHLIPKSEIKPLSNKKYDTNEDI